MILEKHLAAYLPYKIKIRVFRENESLFIEDVEITGEVIDYIFETKEYSKYKYKPILRPLSDLIKEIEVDGKRFVPNEVIKSYNPNFYYFERNNCIRENTETCIIEYPEYGAYPYWLMELLLSWHFDVFGLIGKYACDYNEYKNK